LVKNAEVLRRLGKRTSAVTSVIRHGAQILALGSPKRIRRTRGAYGCTCSSEAVPSNHRVHLPRGLDNPPRPNRRCRQRTGVAFDLAALFGRMFLLRSGRPRTGAYRALGLREA
jgi:hypothetical protein